MNDADAAEVTERPPVAAVAVTFNALYAVLAVRPVTWMVVYAPEMFGEAATVAAANEPVSVV